MLHQLRYTFKKRPTAADIHAARERWLKGLSTPGVQITAVSWSRDRQDVRAAVRSGYVGRAGRVKCQAAPTRTMCDYDRAAPPSLWLVWRVARMLGIKPGLVRMDRTRRGWHLIIEWRRRFRPLEIVAIQCVLGSDSKRELFNLARVFSGKARNPRWNILFDRKVT